MTYPITNNPRAHSKNIDIDISNITYNKVHKKLRWCCAYTNFSDYRCWKNYRENQYYN